MKKEKVIVPKGIRFISEWNNFVLPEYPCIIDKKIPGCGFTEYCICNSENVILCSPRKILLENKENQHPLDVLYIKNELDQDETVDKDLSKITRGSTLVPTNLYNVTPEDIKTQIIESLNKQILEYIEFCKINSKPCKILVTYDSFRLVKEAIQDEIDNFRVVIDEFQSIFTDSRFKSSTELEFVSQLRNLDRICFVSATPMIDEYLEQLDEFKDLPYYELDWQSEDPLRVLKPDLKVRTCKSVNDIAYKIISDYLSGNYENTIDRSNNVVFSKEAVFYVNSVSNILGIINKCGLQPDQCNILIAKTPDNEKKLKKRLGRKWEIGSVPLCGEPHKMFTFCTRTVYIGADFYSTNARTFVLSDADIDTLTVDISLDLPQILGRQRLDINPWKNHAELYYRTTTIQKTKEEFDEFINSKLKKTNSLLKAYNDTTEKDSLADIYQKNARTFNYHDDYVAVNEHGGSSLIPCLNKLVMLAEQRSFDIQQIDYKDRFSVFNSIYNSGLMDESININVKTFLVEFNNLTRLPDKLRVLCESDFTESELGYILDQIPITYKNYYISLGPAKCKSLGYRYERLQQEYDNICNLKISSSEGLLEKELSSEFSLNNKYTLSDIKYKLKNIYSKIGCTRTPKASDIEEYFNVRRTRILQKEGYLILGRK